MRMIERFICLLFITVLFSACNGTIFADTAVIDTPVPQVTSIPTNTLLPLTHDPDAVAPILSDDLPLDGLVLAAHMYADGTCYDLGIYQDGHYSVLSCLPGFTYPTSTGFLDEYKLSYLNKWVERFQSFEEPSSEGFLKFVGNGVILPDFSDIASMRAMISDIEWDAHGYIHKGGFPSPVLLAKEVLSNKLGIPLDNKSVLKFEVAEFPDACLGVPEAGEVCSQSVRQGFRIQLVAQGMLYEFHTDIFGYDIRQFGEPQIAPTPGPVG